MAMRAGSVSSYLRTLANMMALFNTVGYAADPTSVRDTFGVSALTRQEWAGGDH
jgi:hypothetical protein